jgi:hypothetical protein
MHLPLASNEEGLGRQGQQVAVVIEHCSVGAAAGCLGCGPDRTAAAVRGCRNPVAQSDATLRPY